MTYLVTARKWRPQVFEDIVGQLHVTTTLKNAIATNRLSHAYIFSGPRGVGKTTTARILAKAINCRSPKDINPDNTCDLCTEITEGRSVNVFEIDGASNRGVDEIRNLRDAVRYGPASGKYKIYIIDEVHMLTKEAFNALLKTLEEPPSYILFIFATTEIHKVPLTILSRCQRFDFRRVPLEEIVGRLDLIAKEEKISVDEGALFTIAKRADGSLRDAQSIFDQAVSFSSGPISSADIMNMLNIVDDELYFRTTDLIRSKDTSGGLALVDEIISRGYDIREFLAGLTEHLRSLFIGVTTGSAKFIETSEASRKRYLAEAKTFSENRLLRLIKIAHDTDTSVRWSQSSSGRRFALEIGLMTMMKLDETVEIGRLLQDLEELKKKLSGEESGTPAREPRPAAPDRPVLRRTGGFSTGTAADAGVAPRSETSPLQQAAPAAPQPVSVPPEDAAGKWTRLVAEACRERIAVGTMLSSTNLIDISDSNIRVACPDDFHLDALKRNRQYILDLAEKVYGARLKLETILSSGPGTGTQSEAPKIGAEQQKSSAAPPPGPQDPSKHPVIEALIREFGAREVE